MKTQHELTRQVFDLIYDKSKNSELTSRPYLNTYFKSTSDIKLQSLLSDVLASLVFFDHVCRSRDEDTYVDSYWVSSLMPMRDTLHVPLKYAPTHLLDWLKDQPVVPVSTAVADLTLSQLPEPKTIRPVKFEQPLVDNPEPPVATFPAVLKSQPAPPYKPVNDWIYLVLKENAPLILSTDRIYAEIVGKGVTRYNKYAVNANCSLMAKRGRIKRSWTGAMFRNKPVYDYCALSVEAREYVAPVQETPVVNSVKQDQKASYFPVDPAEKNTPQKELHLVSQGGPFVSSAPSQEQRIAAVDVMPDLIRSQANKLKSSQAIEVKHDHIVFFTEAGHEVKLVARDIKLISLFKDFFPSQSQQ